MSTSLTIAHALGQPSKIKSSWGKEAQSASRKEDTRSEKLQERLNWRVKGSFEATHKQFQSL